MEKGEKDTILSEFKKTATRLKSKGIDLSGIYYGINDRIREAGNLAFDDEDYREDNPILEDNIPWKPEDEFIKIFPEELNKIAFNLTGAETLTLIRLLCFIDFGTGMLRKKDGLPLLTSDIISLTGFSKVTVIDIMEDLVLKRILSRNKVGRTYQYFANPYIFFKGRYINPTLVAMFKDYRKK